MSDTTFNPALAAQQFARVQPQGPDITAPVGVPACPFDDKPSSELERRGIKTWREVKRYAEAHAARIEDARRSLAGEEEAKRTLEAEIERGAAAGKPDAEREAELALAYEKAKACGTEEFHRPRIQGAYDAYIRALDAFEKFMKANVVELTEEIRPAAERVASEYRKAHAEARKLLDPVEAEHRELRARVAQITSYQDAFRVSLVPEGDVAFHPSHWANEVVLSVPDQFDAPPIPTREQVADYRERKNPRPATADETEADA